MLVKAYGCALHGIEAVQITIEVEEASGTKWFMVGLPDNAVKESQYRIESAINNSDYRFKLKKYTINLAPADLRKEGSAYDLPIAVSILAATNQILADLLSKYIIMGELSLDGSLLPIKGALPIALAAEKLGFEGFILPRVNAEEAAVVSGLKVFGMDRLADVAAMLDGQTAPDPLAIDAMSLFSSNLNRYEFDFADVKGQENVKRALEIAAAGGHNVIMIGPPGSGKTMLSKRIPSILPPMSLEEALETTKIHSVAGKLGPSKGLIGVRPFRAPHHTVSDVALVGGGSYPQPGEISLAHNGVLFLDELPEFKRSVLEVLRQPVEDRVVTISRARFSVEYPAGIMLVAAMNPCPCGYYNHPEKECTCPAGAVGRYLSRISGPLLDRIDLHIEVVPVPFRELSSIKQAETSMAIRQRVEKARLKQHNRFKGQKGIYCNAQISTRQLRQYCAIDETGNTLLKNAMDRLNLSARAYDRILKVARTIADIEGCESIQTTHLAEAIQYRSLDRENWGTA